MQMSDGEIFTRYRQAKKKSEQVKILAQLNGVSTERIIEILVSKGVDNRCFNNFRSRLNNQDSKKSAATEPTVNYMQKHVEESLKKAVTEQLEKAKNITPVTYGLLPTYKQSIDSALDTIRCEIEDINRQQYELDQRKAEIYQKLWDMLGGVS